MALPCPFRLLDPSGRTLVWVLINKGTDFHSKVDAYESDACKIILSPRPGGPGTPQDIVSRPCYAMGSNGFFRLKDDMHEWFETLDLNYQLEYRYVGLQDGWYVGFLPENKDKAALFKLTWHD